MKLLKEIYRKSNLKMDGKVFHRKAVRGVIIREKDILMIYSSENKDYKFPGGGMEEGESFVETLIREIQEECGAKVLNIGEAIGKIIEYNEAEEDDVDLFMMTSHYYICNVEENKYQQKLDQYEAELGFEPVWVNIDDAIKSNKRILNSGSINTPRWTERETFVLEYIKDVLGL